MQDCFKNHYSLNVLYTSSEHSKDVSILFRTCIDCTIVSVHCDKIGRMVLVNTEVNGIVCTLCNVYYPNNVAKRVQFLTELKAFVINHSMSILNLYTGGNFNCVDCVSDRVSGVLDKSSGAFTKL